MNAMLMLLLVVGTAALLSWPLGRYMRWAMEPTPADGRLPQTLTRGFHALAGRDSKEPQNWRAYVVSFLVFNALMFTVSYAFMAFQHHLPLNPDAQKAVDPSLVFHTAVSFTTNTNLQHYSGESTFSHLSQLCALMWLQFVSAATGIAALAAMSRALTGRNDVGNFFLDLQRATFLVLLPLSFLLASGLTLAGVPMTLAGAAHATTLEGAEQIIARGPVAAFVAIKQLGTNGGGFFGPNSTHPFENPNFVSNALSMTALVLLPMACVWMFGRLIGRLRHAAVIFGVMLAFLLLKTAGAVWFERAPTVAFSDLPIHQNVGNLEGKELRFGATTGPLWAVLTTSTSNGSVGAMHDSLNPMTGLMPLIGMWLNATFGGVGVGMIGMFIYIVLAVFIAGMMVGRTPEYLNRRMEGREVALAVLALLTHAFLVLGGTALFAATHWGQDTVSHTGPHGFTQILYEFSSASANNGSGFEGLGDNTVPWNLATGLVMILARFVPIILPLAIAASLGAKKPTAPSAGTLGVEDGTFGLLLAFTILFLGALTFLPVAALGPIAEHLQFMR
jgi:K+-transporting ATPase ATPase A chain